MKKLVFLLIIVLFPVFGLFCSSGAEDRVSLSISNADSLIETLSVYNTNSWKELYRLSGDFPPVFQKGLYEIHEKNWLGGFAVNLFLPGVGSWFMGDWQGALTVELGILSGCLILLATLPFAPYGLIEAYGINPFFAVIKTIGAGLFIGSYGANLVIPFTYGINWNQNLRMNLRLTTRYGGPPVYYVYEYNNEVQNGISLPLVCIPF